MTSWPAAGILLNQGMTNEVSSLLSLFTGLGVKSFRSRSPGLFFLVIMFESHSNHSNKLQIATLAKGLGYGCASRGQANPYF